MLDPLYKLIGWVLAFYYGIIPNLGVAIILLTVTVMLLLFPLTAKQAKSMLAMQQLQPEMKKLQAKYKGDRQKLNEEMMKLYQEHKVNPLGGCLPLLAQMPVFIALFSVLRSVHKNVPTDSDLYRDLCGSAASGGQCDPTHLTFLGMDLTVTPLNATGGFFSVLPYFVLVALIVLTGLIQSRQTARTTPPGANPQMQMIGKVLPIVFGVISLNFPAGLCVYFLVSNLWRLGQQEWIFRNIHLPHRERLAAKDGKGSSDGAKDRKAVEAPAEPEAESEPEPPPAKPVVQPRRPAKATPAPGPDSEATPPAKEAPPARAPGGGLRSLFRLPPAPNGGEGGAGGSARPAQEAKPGTQARPSSSSSSSRSASAGNRSGASRKRNRKKRKR